MAGTMHGRAVVVVVALVVCLASVAAAQPYTSGRVVFQSASTGSDSYWLGLVNAYNGDVCLFGSFRVLWGRVCMAWVAF